MEIIFCDINHDFTKACSRLISQNVHLYRRYKLSIYNGDVADLKVKRAAYISPANSFGSMGGGIDKIYNHHMFPGIQKTVMAKIESSGTPVVVPSRFDRLKKGERRPHLPVGEAISTPLDEYSRYRSCHLISAPTMVVPSNVSDTNNAYLAFMASLQLIDRDLKDVEVIVCPGMGTGVGMIPPKESAKQIFRAINVFSS